MSSSFGPLESPRISASEDLPAWRLAGLRYYALSFFLRQKFGGRVWKLSLDAGCSCPNVDGTISDKGCIFCDLVATAPSRRLGLGALSVHEQIEQGIARVAAKRRIDQFIAYFQPGTNTHGELGRLVDLWRAAASHPRVVGVAIGTRPDALPEAVLDALVDLAQITWVQLEIGVQTFHDSSLGWLRRHHTAADNAQAIRRAKARGLFVVAHVILGIPGEELEAIVHTADKLNELGVDAVKIHNLHVLKDTDLESLWRQGQFQPMDRTQYVHSVATFLEHLSPGSVVERLVGDAPAEFLLAPAWSLQKSEVIREIDKELIRRDSFQGRFWRPAAGDK
ncbi:MAG: TIGR01212 family radical SAM protein [Thermoguttaceae bacterium]|nr:TIGR01212 family radical SAM protein [Thermoguttaceae bacterium]MDW8079745.1 TIGR01212 family radical SAM protein [Thermoguttaceae bacterium]